MNQGLIAHTFVFLDQLGMIGAKPADQCCLESEIELPSLQQHSRSKGDRNALWKQHAFVQTSPDLQRHLLMAAMTVGDS